MLPICMGTYTHRSMKRDIYILTCLWSQVASACRGLKQGLGSWPEIEVRPRQWEHWILTTRPVASDKALALRLCRKEFPQRQRVVKQAKCLLGGKRVQYVWIDTLVGSERQSCPPGSLNHLYGAFLPGFLWPVILICVVQSPYLVYGQSFWFAWFRVRIWYISGSSHVCACISQPR